MRTARIHPYYAAVRISLNHIENNSRYSLTYLLRTLNRRFLFSISILMIILICGFVIPLTIILSHGKKTYQSPPPPTRTTTDRILDSTINTTEFDDSTINIDTSMTNIVTDIYLVSNNTLENNANNSIILTTGTVINTN
ncbi:unnamed protein product [Rotaria sordida]|uniref:Uncharacterized protein n=1 Tax=Rotaria sordida TaxID=392033 RepID=A0A814VCY0_9BILA|nr:unnamed protein product [Rotaria sordida]CAF1187344.1 unnamed protein product [Rotaria sordida]CAF1204539.1 unnamed protein product [Rotaria sordida]CAF1451809.1 unnamed protein product [Rotaria sordida]CAF3727950.1 unnamed protein product [Rotaria sordida]